MMVHDEKILSEEIATYEENKIKLLKESAGKYVLIKGKTIVNVYDSQNDAIKVGIDKFGNSPFLVKKITEVDEKQNFTSNLIKISPASCPQ